MGKYVVRETETGWKFDLKAVNGEVIATSQVYASKEGALDGIASLKKIASKANLEDQIHHGLDVKVNPKFEVYLDASGKHRFRLKARNGEIIVFSESYTTKASCLNGIESIRKNAKSEYVVL